MRGACVARPAVGWKYLKVAVGSKREGTETPDGVLSAALQAKGSVVEEAGGRRIEGQ